MKKLGGESIFILQAIFISNLNIFDSIISQSTLNKYIEEERHKIKNPR